jgi:cytochrome c oxidase cbb3-type subunit I/II
MWRAFDETGRLAYPDFIETVLKLMPMYWMRAVGGTLYIIGMVMFGWNILMTWRTRPAVYEEPIIRAAPLVATTDDGRSSTGELHPAHASTVVSRQSPIRRFVSMDWHRAWERRWVFFSVATVIAVVVASLFEIIPTFLIRSNVPTIASVKPYTPLELAGRDIYIREGCFNCHSQMIRPFRHETERFGEYSKPGEFVYDHPFLWGSRRIGPDLAREGGKYPDLWHVRHMQDPRSITAQSIMPAYPQMLSNDLDYDVIQSRVDAMAMLGVPYGDAVKDGVAKTMAERQAKEIAVGIEQQGGPAGLEKKEIVALTAYLQRLGRDIKGVSAPVAQASVGGAR